MTEPNTELTLAKRLLVWVGEMSKRSDITISQQRQPWSATLRSWQGLLPEDLFRFYLELNGFAFTYDQQVGDERFEAMGGFQINALHEDGHRTVNLFTKGPGPAFQRVGDFADPASYFGDAGFSEDDKVLFVIGDSSASAILMVGDRERPKYYSWNNDGDTVYLTDSFTEILERGMARSFVHMWWEAEPHPLVTEGLARLAVPVPPRKTFEVTVEASGEADEHAYRVALGGSSEFPFSEVMKALGRKERARSLSSEERGRIVDEACGDLSAIDAKKAKAVMSEFRGAKTTKKAFAEHFRIGAAPLARVVVRVRYLKGPIRLDSYSDALLRVLHEADGAHVTDDFPGDPAILSYCSAGHFGIRYWPFVEDVWHQDFQHGEALVELWLEPERAAGLEQGRTFSSSALPGLQMDVGA